MKIKFTTNIDKELLQEIKIRALKENKNVNEIIEILFKDYLEKSELNGFNRKED